MRQNYQDLPSAQWTEEEALHHLNGTFDRACRSWPDIMEPYVVQLADGTKESHKALMQRALRETVNQRYAGV